MPSWNTRYEIAARHSDGREIVVGYIARRSGRGLADKIQAEGGRLVAELDLPEDAKFKVKAKPRPHTFIHDWWIGFTGRTLLDRKSST